MADQKESSVLFSLKELMNLEEDRIKSEEDAKVSAQRQVQERSAAAEHAKREAEAARIRGEEEARRQEEQRRREEETRLEAIRHGEIEKARTEAEHRARMEAMNAQQAHEQQLAAMKGDKSQKKLKVMIGAAVASLVLVAVGGTVMYLNNAEENRKTQATQAKQLQEAEERVKESDRKMKALEEAGADLERELRSVKDEAGRALLVAKIKANQDAVKNMGGGGRPRPAGSGKTEGKPCSCPPGDPLCSCL